MSYNYVASIWSGVRILSKQSLELADVAQYVQEAVWHSKKEKGLDFQKSSKLKRRGELNLEKDLSICACSIIYEFTNCTCIP